jgi:hypothetical protein
LATSPLDGPHSNGAPHASRSIILWRSLRSFARRLEAE